MKIDKFNIFHILEKDSKELIHSAFIKYLIQRDNHFFLKFLKLDQYEFQEPKLEKTYIYSKKQRARIDIEAISIDEKSIIIIENKFKSFPYLEQLVLYDKIYNKHHKGKNHYKFLMCFNKDIIGQFPNWIIKDYKDLLEHIKTSYDLEKKDEETIFIKHYYEILNEYFVAYKKLENDFRDLLINPYREDNKFWLKVFYSAFKLKLEKYFLQLNLDIRVDLVSGNTNIPLMNIVPINWKLNQKELLIQFQGNDLKFYSHCNNREFINELVEFSRNNLFEEHFDYKKLSLKESNTYFIFKTKITNELKDVPINLTTMFDITIKFYEKINNQIINNYC